MRGLLQDIRFGIRLLLRNPVVSIAAILCLGLGIGATTAVFSVINGILTRPLPYKEPDRLVALFSQWERDGQMQTRNPHSGPDYLDISEQSHSFEQTAIFSSRVKGLRGDDGVSSRSVGLSVSSSFFDLMGLKPVLGRIFSPEECWPNDSHLVILGHGAWTNRYGADPEILGKGIILDDQAYAVIGVMPQGLTIPITHPEYIAGAGEMSFDSHTQISFWIPIEEDLRSGGRGMIDWDCVARLKPEVDVAQAQSEMGVIARSIDEIRRQELDKYYQRGKSQPTYFVEVISLHDDLIRTDILAIGNVWEILLLIQGAAIFVLLIASANVANLLCALGMKRKKEMALRAALGGSWIRLARQLTTESLTLAAAGGAFGVLLGVWGLDLLRAVAPAEISNVHQIQFDFRVLAFAAAVTLLTGALVAITPIFWVLKTDLNDSLRQGEQSSTASRQHNRLTQFFVIGEVSLAFVLLLGGGLILNSFMRMTTAPLGFDPENVLTMKLGHPRSERFSHQQLLDNVKGLPGVQSAALVVGMPFSDDVKVSYTETDEKKAEETGTDWQGFFTVHRFVTPEYFEVLKISLTRGQRFNESDRKGSGTIISESASRWYWGDENPISRTDSELHEGFGVPSGITGVVKDVKAAYSDEVSLYG